MLIPCLFLAKTYLVMWFGVSLQNTIHFEDHYIDVKYSGPLIYKADVDKALGYPSQLDGYGDGSYIGVYKHGIEVIYKADGQMKAIRCVTP